MRKKMLSFISFTGVSVVCMVLELSNILISLSISSTMIVLKEKSSYDKFEAIAIILIAFQVRMVFVFWQWINISQTTEF